MTNFVNMEPISESEDMAEKGTGAYLFRTGGSRPTQGVDDTGDEHGSSIWKPVLPHLRGPPDNNAVTLGRFDRHELVRLLQAGKTGAARIYLEACAHDQEAVKTQLGRRIATYPVMFYVVESGDVQMIRECLRAGGEPNAALGKDKMPLIVFAILRGAATLQQATAVLEVLLRCGASPKYVPSCLFTPYNRDRPGAADLARINTEGRDWCTPAVKKMLVKRLSLTQRYRLFQASAMKPLSTRQVQVAHRYKAEEVLGIHHAMIGQTMAADSLITKFLSYLAMPRKKPLVLVFAGPSGHGKTQLARQMGTLLSLDMEVVNMTTYRRETELWGPRAPYQGHAEGSRLNNFLQTKSGQSCIVFLDEFEKSTAEVHASFLIPWDEGVTQDRRTLTPVDCTKSIWILATNQFDATIHAFCRRNEETLFSSDGDREKEKTALVRTLCKKLEAEAKSAFGAPLTGRISDFLPFLVFSPDERAVVAHKFFMETEARLARPVALSAGADAAQDNLVGHCRVAMARDAVICSRIARDYYDADLGARSIANGVERAVTAPLTEAYLADGDAICEDQDVTRVVVELDREENIEVRVVHNEGRGTGSARSEDGE